MSSCGFCENQFFLKVSQNGSKLPNVITLIKMLSMTLEFQFFNPFLQLQLQLESNNCYFCSPFNCSWPVPLKLMVSDLGLKSRSGFFRSGGRGFESSRSEIWLHFRV